MQGKVLELKKENAHAREKQQLMAAKCTKLESMYAEALHNQNAAGGKR